MPDEPEVDVVRIVQSDGPLYRAGMTPTGYSLPEGLTYDEWSEMGPPLVAMAQSAAWWLGDWLRYGEHHYGDKYVQAVEATGYGVSTLKNYQWVADRIPIDERVPDVPFSHHKAVASLDRVPRNKLLREASRGHLTEHEVRDTVRVLKAESAAGGSTSTAPPQELTADQSLREALASLDRAIEDHDWKLVGAARKYVADARAAMAREAKASAS
jgi:hypothetical protein